MECYYSLDAVSLNTVYYLYKYDNFLYLQTCLRLREG